jgi:hypothetical protein
MKDGWKKKVSTPTITASLQHLLEIRKVLLSVENSEEMLGCFNKIENFLFETHCQNLKQSKIDEILNYN